MFDKSILSAVLLFGSALTCIAQEDSSSKPIELEALKATVGVWDAEFEVWPEGPGSTSIKFKGVETNRAHGEYWIASDLDSEFMGQTMRVHCIVGYDLDRKKLVGTVVDDGPYAASMTGEYDEQSKTVRWMTEAKDASGNRIVQKTEITHESTDERVLVLSVPAGDGDDFTKFMQIRFARRK